jgi:hypothetical protein
MDKVELIKAYTETEYIIPVLDLTIRIGEKNKLLDNVQHKYFSVNWAFISAENPRSNLLSDEENSLKSDLLENAIKQLDRPYFIGYGKGKGDWKPEKSFLVLKTSKIEAIDIFGIPFEQNAIVIGQIRKAAKLLVIDEIFQG